MTWRARVMPGTTSATDSRPASAMTTASKSGRAENSSGTVYGLPIHTGARVVSSSGAWEEIRFTEVCFASSSCLMTPAEIGSESIPRFQA